MIRWAPGSFARVVRAASGAMAIALAAVAADAQPPDVDAEIVRLVERARADIDTFWRGRITGYVPPADVVRVEAPAETDCGPFPKPNARFCSGTNKIYWDVSLFADNYKLGDFAPVFILAHEWGHLVQRLLGFSSTARGLLPCNANCRPIAWRARIRQMPNGAASWTPGTTMKR